MKFWPNIQSKKLSAQEEREMEYINADLLRKVVYFEWILIVMCSLGEYGALTYEPPSRPDYRAEIPQDFAQQNRRLDNYQATVSRGTDGGEHATAEQQSSKREQLLREQQQQQQ